MKRFINCRAYAFDPPRRRYHVFDGFVVDGTAFAAFGEDAGAGVETVDLAGATVVAAFADCHLHLTATGLLLGARDLSDVWDRATFVARVHALPDGPCVYAARYDDSGWPDGAANAEPLERAFPDRLALVTRVDGHSSLVNRHTFAELGLDEDLDGVERDPGAAPTGRLFATANSLAQGRFFERIPAAQRRTADRAAHALALERGVVHLHVQLERLDGRDGYATEIAGLRRLGPAKWHPKICERAPALARELGLPYVGGDVFLDGSLGSGTAALRAPYCDRAGTGRLAFGDDEVFAYFAEAEALGISAGVHAIGDAAIEQCIAAWEEVLGGEPSPRNRHFIEHFEVATAEQVARAGRLGLYLSMQPQFDATWGAPGGMYERRLGTERAHGMNALRSALAAGAVVCGGDDSPVCPLAPLAGMAAACNHHTAGERLSPLEALTMYTYDAARLGHAERSTGLLAAGYDADFTVLEGDPFVDGSFAQTRVLETWLDGARVYP